MRFSGDDDHCKRELLDCKVKRERERKGKDDERKMSFVRNQTFCWGEVD